MIENHPPLHIITVPIGLGGKTTPYMADPAPTLVLELPSSETVREESRIAQLSLEAEAEARAICEQAEADAATRREAADLEATELIQNATADAEARIESAEARIREIEERLQQIEARELSVTEKEFELAHRLAAVDAEAAESAALLAAARDDAESIIAEAQATAEGIIDEARREASEEAHALIAAATATSDADLEARLEEIESVHRIELKVLREREQELLERVTALEAIRHEVKANPTGHAADVGDDHLRNDDLASSTENGQHAVGVASDGRTLELKPGGRHTGDPRSFDRDPTPISAHVTLTEQLSTNAFRTAEKDRRGRRRR